MTKLITLTATFECKAALVAQSPMTVNQTYEDGSPLSKKDTAKADKITAYYLAHDIWPVFVPLEPIKDDNAPVTAQAWIDLSLWTNEGLPMFAFKGMEDGKPSGLPMAKRRGKASEYGLPTRFKKSCKIGSKKVSPRDLITTLFT